MQLARLDKRNVDFKIHDKNDVDLTAMIFAMKKTFLKNGG